MTAAAFQATYSDWRIIKGRKVVQVVLELPIEKADEAYQVLGGMPIAANEIWCAVARLDPKTQRNEKEVVPSNSCAETKPRPVQSPGSVGAEKVRRSFDEMSPAQQAGMLCGSPAFRRFLLEDHPEVLRECCGDSAACVREICKVNSRADIGPNNAEWHKLLTAYRNWQLAASVVPA